jgi:hypothetical protein
MDAFPFFDFPRRGHARRHGEEKANGVPGLTKLVILGSSPLKKRFFHVHFAESWGLRSPRQVDGLEDPWFPSFPELAK